MAKLLIVVSGALSTEPIQPVRATDFAGPGKKWREGRFLPRAGWWLRSAGRMGHAKSEYVNG
jgi:hypothetical protein